MAKITLKSIVADICYAQACSDSGKDIYVLESKHYVSNLNKCYYYAYSDKNFYIKRAIDAIRHAPYLGVEYYVSKEKEDRNNLIVYFNIKMNNKKYQVSFHSPGFSNSILREYYDPKRRRIRWNSHYSSREICKKLVRMLDI